MRNLCWLIVRRGVTKRNVEVSWRNTKMLVSAIPLTANPRKPADVIGLACQLASLVVSSF